jgi:hypothetical protein
LRIEISKIAADTLATAREYGWEHVFGKIQGLQAPRVQILRAAAVGSTPTKPWGSRT